MSASLDVPSFEMGHEGKKLLEVNDIVSVQINCIEQRTPQRFVLPVATEEAVELIAIQWARSQRCRVQAEIKIHLLEVVKLLRPKRTVWSFFSLLALR